MATQRDLDPQTALVLADLDGPGVAQVADMTPVDARRHIEDFVRKWDLDPKPPIGAVEELAIPGQEPGRTIRARLYRPTEAAGALPLVVFFHAGGYVFGSIETHESFCRLISEGAGCLVISVDYRRAPEHKFPAAHEDCYTATVWAAAHAGDLGADPQRLAVGGDSSGGTLAIGVCQLAYRRGGPSIAHQFLWYPGTAGGPETESMRTLSEGYFLNSGLMKWSMGHFLNGPSDLADPLVAPMKLEDFSIFPPTYLMTAGFDPRRDDNKAFVDALAAAGVPATCRVLDSTIHGCMFMLGGIGLAVEAAKESAAYIRAAFG